MRDTPQVIGELRPASAPGLPPKVAGVLLDRLEPGEELLWNGPARGVSAQVWRWGRIVAGVVAALLVMAQITVVREQGLDAYMRDVLPEVVFGVAVVGLFAWLFLRAQRRVHYVVTNRRAALYRPIMGASFAFTKSEDGRRRWQRDYSDSEYDPLTFMPLGPEAAVAVDGADIVWNGLENEPEYDGIGADMLALFADRAVDVFSRWKVAGDAHTAARRINVELARRSD